MGMTIFERAREVAVVGSAAGVLGWDQEVGLPAKAAGHRAAQLAWLAARAHEMATSDDWRRALAVAEAGAEAEDFKTQANLRELRREFDRSTKLPVEFVARESSVASLAKHAWAAARRESDFAAFAPHLKELLGLAREKADLLGYPEEPYDALLEDYERGMLTSEVARLFDGLRPDLREIAALAVERSAARRVQLPAGPYPVAAQEGFNARVAEAVGFDFSAGRIDTTTHPFCTRVGPRDVRLTTRYDESDFTSSLFGVLHEAGHGLYELGLAEADFGLPSGSSVSLGIHESQSRMWENQVGRSEAFWAVWYPAACEAFPQLRGFALEDFMQYLWRAEFSPIRVEADEATYDLHILLRFDLERRMLNGSLEVAEVPEAWNAGFRELFGFAPPDDRHGCLQDIHWSMGGLGYFATYTLGNLNAAQLHEAARKDGAVAAAMDRADYAPLLGWLRWEVHAHGGTLDPADLMERATGARPHGGPYLRHLRRRYVGE
jgi:carboxypeptidase Taq